MKKGEGSLDSSVPGRELRRADNDGDRSGGIGIMGRHNEFI